MDPRGPPPTPQGDPLRAGTPSDPRAGCRPTSTPRRGPPQAEGKRRGPDTPKLSQRPPPRSARPSAPPRSRKLPARGHPGTRPLYPRLALHPFARRRSSFISTHRPPPFSSQLSFKSETRRSARSRRHCRRHRLSRRGRRRRCVEAEAAAARAAARGPPGYVVPRPRPALPVPGGLARPGPWVPPPGGAGAPRGRGSEDPLAGVPRSLPGSCGWIRSVVVQPQPCPDSCHTCLRPVIANLYGAFIVCQVLILKASIPLGPLTSSLFR